jgi:hypothetical protein
VFKSLKSLKSLKFPSSLPSFHQICFKCLKSLKH